MMPKSFAKLVERSDWKCTTGLYRTNASGNPQDVVPRKVLDVDAGVCKKMHELCRCQVVDVVRNSVERWKTLNGGTSSSFVDVLVESNAALPYQSSKGFVWFEKLKKERRAI
jgi:hypothetical protein